METDTCFLPVVSNEMTSVLISLDSLTICPCIGKNETFNLIKLNVLTMASVIVENYSEKAIVVRNTMEHHGPIMTELGGTFNEKLKGGRGWIFSKFKFTQVKNIVEKLNSGQYGNEYEQKTAPMSVPNVSSSSSNVEMVSKSEYLSLLTRVERLEALVSSLTSSSVSAATVATSSASSASSTAKSSQSKPVPVPVRMVRTPSPELEQDNDEQEPIINKRLTQIRK